MCLGSAPSAPAPPPAVPEAAVAPTAPSERRGDRDVQRRRAAAGGAGRSTILTGARGVQDGAATAQKTLLGE